MRTRKTFLPFKKMLNYNLIGNDGVQNTMIPNHFCEVFQNLHFTDKRKDDKTEKAFIMRPVRYCN